MGDAVATDDERWAIEQDRRALELLEVVVSDPIRQLILIGGLVLSGRHIGTAAPQRLATRISKGAGTPGLRGYAAFGVAYGAASLGCTLPLFLALMGTATATNRLYGAAILAFVLYGAGMAASLAVLTSSQGW